LLGSLIEAFSLCETAAQKSDESDVEEGHILMLTRLNLVARLIDTKQRSATTSFSTQIVHVFVTFVQ